MALAHACYTASTRRSLASDGIAFAMPVSIFLAGGGIRSYPTTAPPWKSRERDMGPASAAVCEIDGCGVLAVGRCATCKRAFCSSHQGYGRDSFMHPIPYIDMCAPCMEAKKAADAKRAEEARAPYFYFESGTARAELLASGVQSVPLYVVRQEWKVTKTDFWGRAHHEMVDNVQSVGRGWILGMFKWKFNLRDGETEARECLTALVDESHDNLPVPLHGNRGLTCVGPYADGYQDLSRGRTDSFQGDWQTGYGWREAMEAVKQLVGKPN